MRLKNSLHYFLTTLLLASFISFDSFSQAKKKKKVNPNRYEWGNIGMGIPVSGLRSDVTDRSYGVDYNRKIGLLFVQGGIDGNLKQDIPSQFGIHFGGGYAIGFHKPVMVAMSIGPGYYAGDSEDDKRYRAFGANGTVQFLLKPVSDIGIGAELFFNIPFAGNISNLPSSNGIRIVLTISTK